MNPKVELLTAAKRYLWDGVAPPNDEVTGISVAHLGMRSILISQVLKLTNRLTTS